MELDTIHTGNALDILKTLPDRSIHACITSPPYWGLRDYGIRDQLGLENTPEAYVQKLVEIFSEVRRVLHDDGTLWLNMGDSYASGKGTCRNPGGGKNSLSRKGAYPLDKGNVSVLKACGLKQKDLVGIPWRVVFALQADGWYLRSDIIWHKPNPMPESVKDRPTKSHEYIFFLTKSRKYYFDQEAVKEPTTGNAHHRGNGVNPKAQNWRTPAGWDTSTGKGGHGSFHKQGREKGHIIKPRQNESFSATVTNIIASRNLRSVWTITSEPFPGNHFATFPQKLIEPCIKAGTSEKGCCPECGAPWKRVVRKIGKVKQRWPGASVIKAQYGTVGKTSVLATGYTAMKCTVGWQLTCNHNLEPVPCAVLDPFMGSGTTAVVAKKLGRHFVGIELNPAYVRMAKKRVKQECKERHHNDEVIFHGKFCRIPKLQAEAAYRNSAPQDLRSSCRSGV